MPRNPLQLKRAVACRWPTAPCVLILIAVAYATPDDGKFVPLPHAHAHNDYEHARPLQDALDQGFCSVEADVFLVDGELRVGHTRSQLQPGRTLQSLYLDPLRTRVRANGGRVFKGTPDFSLLIDIKTDADATYAALAQVLAEYDDIFSATNNGVFQAKAVTAVLSGNRAVHAISAAAVRHVGVDGRPSDLASNAAPHLMPWISENWKSIFRWNGVGQMPSAEQEKLTAFVRAVHAKGRKVRFWNTPETEDCWHTLRAAQVDLINTDNLARLRRFFLSQR